MAALAGLALFWAALPAAAATGIEQCRSTAPTTNAALLAACTAVIDAGQASAADTAYAYYRRAMVSAANPNADPAQVMADVSKAIDLDPKLMEAYAFRALGYNRAQDYDKAIADLGTAIGLAPERWGLYSLRAMVYAQKKDMADALADFRRALEHNPPETSAVMIRQRIAKLEQAPGQ